MEKERCLRELALPLLGKWSIFIVLTLAEEEMYFAQLEREIGMISRKMLSQTLNDLIEIPLADSEQEKMDLSASALKQVIHDAFERLENE